MDLIEVLLSMALGSTLNRDLFVSGCRGGLGSIGLLALPR